MDFFFNNILHLTLLITSVKSANYVCVIIQHYMSPSMELKVPAGQGTI